MATSVEAALPGLPPMAKHDCVVKKKPSPKASQPWSKCIKSLQKRCLETRGAYVFYYAFPKPKGAKPKGKFDLRELSRLRPAREGDPTAPEFAVEILSNAHHIVLDFENRDQHDACLKIWTSAAPPASMPQAWKNEGASVQAEPLVREMIRRHSRSAPKLVADDHDDEDGGGEAGGGDSGKLLDVSAGGGGSSSSSGKLEERVVKAGPLFKLSSSAGAETWKLRHARLSSHGILRLYEDPNANHMVNSLPLAGCSIPATTERRKDHPNAFRLLLAEGLTASGGSGTRAADGGRLKFLLSANSKQECLEWQKALMKYAKVAEELAAAAARAAAAAGGGGGFGAAAAAASAPGVEAALAPPPPMMSRMNASSEKRRVLVLGTGKVGVATLQALLATHAASCEIFAGTRDPSSAVFKDLAGVTPVMASIDEPEDAWLKGLDSLIVLTPGDEERVPRTHRLAAAAVRAGVRRLVVVSIVTAEQDNNSPFGRQYLQIEGLVKELCRPPSRTKCTIVRHPLLLENYYTFAPTLKASGVMRCSMDPSRQFTPLAVADFGRALAAVGAEPGSKYDNRVLSLAGAAHTIEQMLQWVGEALDRVSQGRGSGLNGVHQLKYERVSPDETARDLMAAPNHLEKWQAAGLLELYGLVSSGHYVYKGSDLRELIGSDPISVQNWIAAPGVAGEASLLSRAAPAPRDSLATPPAKKPKPPPPSEPPPAHLLQKQQQQQQQAQAQQQQAQATPQTPKTPQTPLAPPLRRQPSVVLMDDIEQLLEFTMLLEQEGRTPAEIEAAHEQGMAAAHRRYLEAKAVQQEANLPTPPSLQSRGRQMSAAI